jgi:hypothetical protein
MFKENLIKSQYYNDARTKRQAKLILDLIQNDFEAFASQIKSQTDSLNT